MKFSHMVNENFSKRKYRDFHEHKNQAQLSSRNVLNARQIDSHLWELVIDSTSKFKTSRPPTRGRAANHTANLVYFVCLTTPKYGNNIKHHQLSSDSGDNCIDAHTIDRQILACY